ncbi:MULTISPECIES: response regulator [Novosphingobium]|uniref:Response regulator n=1 Tax=Novosphingobium pentaromativorans TaxID=205844 RepID=A0A2W5Q8V2_9SPHN|nr:MULTISPECIES: response regulator [Novosphingobium]PZQ51163.1 MAG: response regulator [Novosphingobium pentaromativorans]GFE77004.1 response regulator [Novosphingobium sp. TCA1]
MSEGFGGEGAFQVKGLRVLVAEDEVLVAMLLEEMLGDLGCLVVGPHATLADALEAARTDEFDVALIDMNLAGERADPVVAEVAARSVPFAIASGGGNWDLPHQPAVMLNKPYTFAQLEEAMTLLAQSRA